MQDTDRRLDALVYSLGWVVLIWWAWLMAGWTAYVARMAGRLPFIPHAWWPSPEVHLILIAVAKLMLVGLLMAWIGVVLYRRRLRWLCR
jgi:hypothetical protein